MNEKNPVYRYQLISNDLNYLKVFVFKKTKVYFLISWFLIFFVYMLMSITKDWFHVVSSEEETSFGCKGLFLLSFLFVAL